MSESVPILVLSDRRASPDGGEHFHNYVAGQVYARGTVPPMSADLAAEALREGWGERCDGAEDSSRVAGARTRARGAGRASVPMVRQALRTADQRGQAATLLLARVPKGLPYRGAALGGEGARGGQAQCRERAGAGLGQRARWLGTHLGLRRPPRAEILRSRCVAFLATRTFREQRNKFRNDFGKN